MHGSEKGPLLACCVSGVGGRGHRRLFMKKWYLSLVSEDCSERLGSLDKEERPPYTFTDTTFGFTNCFRIWAEGSDQGPWRGTSVFFILPVYFEEQFFQLFLGFLLPCGKIILQSQESN